MMADSLLVDRKIIVCGNGPDSALGQLLVCNLVNRLENDRPALPALALGHDGATTTAISTTQSLGDIFSRQVRALGQPGDILLCITSGTGHSNLIRAVQAAHERNMDVIALSNPDSEELSTLMRSEDAEIRVIAQRQARVIEIQAMVLHCLCDLVDHRLFGSYAQD